MDNSTAAHHLRPVLAPEQIVPVGDNLLGQTVIADNRIEEPFSKLDYLVVRPCWYDSDNVCGLIGDYCKGIKVLATRER